MMKTLSLSVIGALLLIGSAYAQDPPPPPGCPGWNPCQFECGSSCTSCHFGGQTVDAGDCEYCQGYGPCITNRGITKIQLKDLPEVQRANIHPLTTRQQLQLNTHGLEVKGQMDMIGQLKNMLLPMPTDSNKATARVEAHRSPLFWRLLLEVDQNREEKLLKAIDLTKYGR